MTESNIDENLSCLIFNPEDIYQISLLLQTRVNNLRVIFGTRNISNFLVRELTLIKHYIDQKKRERPEWRDINISLKGRKADVVKSITQALYTTNPLQHDIPMVPEVGGMMMTTLPSSLSNTPPSPHIHINLFNVEMHTDYPQLDIGEHSFVRQQAKPNLSAIEIALERTFSNSLLYSKEKTVKVLPMKLFGKKYTMRIPGITIAIVQNSIEQSKNNNFACMLYSENRKALLRPNAFAPTSTWTMNNKEFPVTRENDFCILSACLKYAEYKFASNELVLNTTADHSGHYLVLFLYSKTEMNKILLNLYNDSLSRFKRLAKINEDSTVKSLQEIDDSIKRMAALDIIEITDSSHCMHFRFSFSTSLNNALSDDLVMGIQTLSFTCPLTLCRIQHPGKGRHCKHRQAFDVKCFIECYENKELVKCVICSEVIKWNDLVIDPVFKYLLLRYNEDEKCLVHQDGSFSKVVADGPDLSFENSDDSEGDYNVGTGGKRNRSEVIVLDSESEEETEASPQSKYPRLDTNLDSFILLDD